MSKSRPASHSGTWYESDRSRLTMQIDSCLSSEKIVKCKALIAPHAGFSYSGPCAGKIYSQIETSNIKTIFLLGPSHHAYVNGVSLSSFGSYETPLGNIEIDLQITNELQKSGLFTVMEDQVDISEHSLELHLPFIFKIMHGKIFKLVPLLIGHLDLNSEDQYTKILQHYFTDLSTLFIFSSDFCKRFHYTPTCENKDIPIHSHISELDHEAMKLIEEKNRKEFGNYLKRTKNTICGILLALVEKEDYKIEFVCYQQSSKCIDMNDSSVSYAAAKVVAC